MADTTCNDFLGGRLQILQPVKGYRAGVDPVLLAAAVPARSGQTVLELGCGVGTASLCLHTRLPGLHLSGVEVQPDYAALARHNGEQADASFDVHVGDIVAMPSALRAQMFDHVIANPPFFQRQLSEGARDTAPNISPDLARETGRGEGASLGDWLDAATRRLRAGGYLSLIQRIERLPDLLRACDSRLGAIEVLPLQSRIGRPAKLFLLRARKGARAPFQLHPPLTLHQGERHLKDGDDYTAPISEVLRNGAALPFGASNPPG